MKYFSSVLFAAMAIIAGIAGNVWKCDHWRAAILFWLVSASLGLVALFVGFLESIPKPHLVPHGYGRLTKFGFDGLIFINDGEPAYCVTPPTSVLLGNTGSVSLVFDEPPIPRVSKDSGLQCFVITVKDSGGMKLNDLRTDMIQHNVSSLDISLRYADSKKPTKLRYTTICKIERNTKGIDVSLIKYRFAWWLSMLPWRD